MLFGFVFGNCLFVGFRFFGKPVLFRFGRKSGFGCRFFGNPVFFFFFGVCCGFVRLCFGSKPVCLFFGKPVLLRFGRKSSKPIYLFFFYFFNRLVGKFLQLYRVDSEFVVV